MIATEAVRPPIVLPLKEDERTTHTLETPTPGLPSWDKIEALPDPTFEFFANYPPYKAMNREFVIEALAYVKPDEAIVDLACGPGVNTQTVAEIIKERRIEGVSLKGIDINEQDLEIGRQRVPEATFIHGDATKLNIPDNSVDKVIFYNAIQEMDDPDAVVKEIFRILKPGGKVFIVGGFTDEAFALESSIKGKENEPKTHHALKRRAKVGELRKHNAVRKIAFAILGEEQAVSADDTFALQGNASHVDRLTTTGFTNVKTTAKELPISVEGMDFIGYHMNWLRGIFGDMTNKDFYSWKEKMMAYLMANHRVAYEYKRMNPKAPDLTYSRMFFKFEAQKPFDTEEMAQEDSTAIFEKRAA